MAESLNFDWVPFYRGSLLQHHLETNNKIHFTNPKKYTRKIKMYKIGLSLYFTT